VAEAPARPAPSAAGRAGAGTPASSAPPAAPAPAVAAPHAAAAPSPAPSPAPASAPAPEDSLPYLHQLPDAVQRDVPRVSFGGYMYSASPADRLLLVDKALRHEGEEVAPGLVLEKLLPKAAVMNYRGVRYRVAY
jgi:general secretion pathway protein B